MQSNQPQATIYVAFVLNRRKTATSEAMVITSLCQETSLSLQLA